MARFLDKAVIVTGSSTGIGREIAKLFIEDGAKVTVTGRNERSLETCKEELFGAGGTEDRILLVRDDLRDNAVQKKIVDETVKKFGSIDILVNNAGGLAPDNTSETGFDQKIEAYDYVMDLNVRTMVTLSKLALPLLEKAKGEIINMSSIAGTPVAFPPQPYYSVSKAAISQLTRNMAVEFISKGVRVNAVNPGVITTDIMLKQGQSAEVRDHTEAKMANNPLCVPIGFTGTPRDIAEAVAFLADRAKSRFILGHCLVVDGGSTLISPILSLYSEKWDTL